MNTTRLLSFLDSGVIIAILAVLLLLPSAKPTQIVVNMPADAKPLASLAPVVSSEAKVITQERAVLYWTIFKASLDAGADTEHATYRAEAAVDKVYGPAKP